jgi:hypothetical protein
VGECFRGQVYSERVPEDQAAESQAVREGRELLDAHFFPEGPGSPAARAVDFRENAIRLIILDYHLSIEELLKWILHRRVTADKRLTPKVVTGEFVPMYARIYMDFFMIVYDDGED